MLDDGVELAGAGQVVAERLLDDDPPPGLPAGVGEAGALQLLADQRERPGRDRQVEREVAAGAALVLQGVHGVGEQVEGGRVVEGARHEPEPLGEVAPDVLAERGPRVVAHRLVDDLAEVLVGPVTTGEPDQREARRQQAAVGEVVDRRHELLARQVAGHPEHDHAARAGDPGQPPVPRVAEGVGARRDPGWAHASPRPAPTEASEAPTPSTFSSWASPASWSVRCSWSTGRPWSASTAASPPAWAAMKSPKVNSRPGMARSSCGAVVICR